MKSSFETQQTARLACPQADLRADEGEREVMLGRERVTIRRRMQGIRMLIAVPTCAYRGVVLSYEEVGVGRFRYRVTLRHRDPELSVLLLEDQQESAVIDAWRDWSRFLAQSALVERNSGALETVEEISPFLDAPPRRRGACATRHRRGRIARRRRIGALERLACVHRGEREIVCYE